MGRADGRTAEDDTVEFAHGVDGRQARTVVNVYDMSRPSTPSMSASGDEDAASSVLPSSHHPPPSWSTPAYFSISPSTAVPRAGQRPSIPSCSPTDIPFQGHLRVVRRRRPEDRRKVRSRSTTAGAFITCSWLLAISPAFVHYAPARRVSQNARCTTRTA